MKKTVTLLVICGLLTACNDPSELIVQLDYFSTENTTVQKDLNAILAKQNLPQIANTHSKSNNGKTEIYLKFKDNTLTINALNTIKDTLIAQKPRANILEIEYDGKTHGGDFFTQLMKDEIKAPTGHYTAKLDWKNAKVKNYYLETLDENAKLIKSTLPVNCIYEIPLVAHQSIPNSNITATVPLGDESKEINQIRNEMIAQMNIMSARFNKNVLYFDHVLTLPEEISTILTKAPVDSLYIDNDRFNVFLEVIDFDMGYEMSLTPRMPKKFNVRQVDNECRQIMQDMYPQLLSYQKKSVGSYLLSDVQINPDWLAKNKTN